MSARDVILGAALGTVITGIAAVLTVTSTPEPTIQVIGESCAAPAVRVLAPDQQTVVRRL